MCYSPVEGLVTVVRPTSGTEPRDLRFSFIWVFYKAVFQPVWEPTPPAWWQILSVALPCRALLRGLCSLRPLTGRPLPILLTTRWTALRTIVLTLRWRGSCRLDGRCSIGAEELHLCSECSHHGLQLGLLGVAFGRLGGLGGSDSGSGSSDVGGRLCLVTVPWLRSGTLGVALGIGVLHGGVEVADVTGLALALGRGRCCSGARGCSSCLAAILLAGSLLLRRLGQLLLALEVQGVIFLTLKHGQEQPQVVEGAVRARAPLKVLLDLPADNGVHAAVLEAGQCLGDGVVQ
jgi:hypothetical protein